MVSNDTFNDEENYRWNIWKAGKQIGKTDETIAKSINRKRLTISRLIAKAKANGEYKKYLDELQKSLIPKVHDEFWDLHFKIKEKHKTKAYEQMGRLIEKTITQNINATQNITVKEEPEFDSNALTPKQRESFSNMLERLSNKTSLGKIQP